MLGENEKRSGFREKILPDLEALLQFSLGLTRNGRDAVALMRDAMAEAYRSAEKSIPEKSCKTWLQEILTRRFFNGFRRQAPPNDSISDDNIGENPIGEGQLYSVVASDIRHNAAPAGGMEDEVDYSGAIAGLPAVFRSAMILSYLEGFSNQEIANLTGIKPQAVKSLLDRGRGLLQEELFAYLMGSDNLDTAADCAAALR